MAYHTHRGHGNTFVREDPYSLPSGYIAPYKESYAVPQKVRSMRYANITPFVMRSAPALHSSNRQLLESASQASCFSAQQTTLPVPIQPDFQQVAPSSGQDYNHYSIRNPVATPLEGWQVQQRTSNQGTRIHWSTMSQQSTASTLPTHDVIHNYNVNVILNTHQRATALLENIVLRPTQASQYITAMHDPQFIQHTSPYDGFSDSTVQFIGSPGSSGIESDEDVMMWSGQYHARDCVINSPTSSTGATIGEVPVYSLANNYDVETYDTIEEHQSTAQSQFVMEREQPQVVAPCENIASLPRDTSSDSVVVGRAYMSSSTRDSEAVGVTSRHFHRRKRH